MLAMGGLLFGAFSPPIALLMVLSGAGDPVAALEVCAVTTALGAAGLFVLRRNRRLGPPVPATTPEHSAPGHGRGSARQGTEMLAVVGLLLGVLTPPLR